MNPHFLALMKTTEDKTKTQFDEILKRLQKLQDKVKKTFKSINRRLQDLGRWQIVQDLGYRNRKKHMYCISRRFDKLQDTQDDMSERIPSEEFYTQIWEVLLKIKNLIIILNFHLML